MSEKTTDKSSLIPQVSHKEYREELELCYAMKHSVYVESGPGMGKTQAGQEFAGALAERHPEVGHAPEDHYVERRPVYMDPTTITGVVMPNRELGVADLYPMAYWPTEKNIAAGRFPRHGVIQLDEAPNAARLVLNSLLELLNDRRINGEPIGEGWMVVMTGNRTTDNTGANPLPMALVSRISWYGLTVHPDEFFEYGVRNGVRTDVLAFYTKVRADLLNTFNPTRQEPYACPRSLVRMSKKLDTYEKMNPGALVPAHTLASVVGNSAKVFLGRRNVLTQGPTWEDIVADPENCKVPTERLAVFNTAISIGARADGTNLTKVYPYIQRLGDQEIVNVTMSSIYHRFDSSGLPSEDPKNPGTTAAYADWCRKFNKAKRG
jgi:hypothetical protein